MSQTTVIRLINSLSKSEKRQFKLFTKKQVGDKDYLDLFDLIDQERITNKEVLGKRFKKLYPDTSIDNTARYLLKVLLDCLIQSRVNDQRPYKLLYGLLRVNILNERNLSGEAFKELNKLQELSANIEDSLIPYIIYREKLNYLSGNHFRDHSEKDLVDLQMRARDTLKEIRHTHEHYSLYELLKFRLIYSGKILSDESKRQLNDLLLSEMSIVNARAKDSLESRKLHLLFQSYFFTDIGDYKSALKTFHDLNRLFEKNIHLWRNPPMNYFSSLDGMLDSLRTNGYYEEMNFYIQRLSTLDKPEYPEYFCYLVKKTILIYQLSVFMGNKACNEAVKFVNESNPLLWKEYSMVDEEKQRELLFFLGLTYFQVKAYKKAQKFINEILLIGKCNYHSVIYKATRLLNVLISYENKDLEYLDYEIRSYKRTFAGKGRLLKIENLLFKIIKINPDFNTRKKNDLIWHNLASSLQAVREDKYEGQILKYFDFTEWIHDKLRK